MRTGFSRPLLLPGLLLLAVTLLLAVSGALDRLDNRLGDSLVAAHAGTRPVPADIVFVTIDQKSLEDETLQREAGSWPWPRGIHAELIANLEAHAPAAIAFDVLFNEADVFRPDSDQVLRETALQYGNLFFPSALLDDGRKAPLNALPPSFGATQTPRATPGAAAPLLVPLVLAPENWQGGLINFEKDTDGNGRHARLHTEVDGWRLPSLSTSVARFTGAALPDIDRIRLHWYGKPPRQISYSDLFHDLSRETPTLAADLKDRIVIIGTTAPGLHDMRPTPLATLTPGTEILTTVIANLRSGDWLRDVPARWPLALLLAAALATAFARRVNPLKSGAVLLAGSALLLAASYLLLAARWYVPVAAALTLAWLAFALFSAEAFWRERQDREATVSLFRRFLDPRVVDDLVKSGELARGQKPQAREISILFSDIRGFTTLSETRTPEAVVELLNRYFTQQVEVVFRHGGTLDKFIGDAIMAFWNAPTENPQHAAHAVQAAIDMAEALDRFKAELALSDSSLGDFDIGIGVHTGPAVVGFLGSDDRLDYTAIGDTVNLASRIEGSTKGVSRVLVSEATRAACEQFAPGRFTFVDHGEFHVKGRDQGVRLFEPRN
jgi:adenylate cyclase